MNFDKTEFMFSLIAGTFIGLLIGGLMLGAFFNPPEPLFSWQKVEEPADFPLIAPLICLGLGLFFGFSRLDEMQHLCEMFVAGIVAYVSCVGLFSHQMLFEMLSGFPIGLLLIPATIILAEILFFRDREQLPEDENKFWFTAKKKALLVAISGMIVFACFGAVAAVKSWTDWFGLNIETVGEWLTISGQVIGYGTIILVVLYLYIKLNSLKFKKKQKKVKKK